MGYEAPFSPSLQAMDLAAPVQEDKHCSPIESDASPSLLWVGFDNGTAIQKAEMRWARWRSCSVEFLTFDELLAWLKQVPSKPEGAQRMLSMIQPFHLWQDRGAEQKQANIWGQTTIRGSNNP